MTLDKIRVSGPRPSGPAGRSRPRERINFRARTREGRLADALVFLLLLLFPLFPHQKAVQTFVQKAKAEGVYTHMIPK